MISKIRPHLFLAALLGLYGVVATLFAIRTPDWQTPDEPAHYNYIAQIVEQHKLPVIAPGDWDQPYLDELKEHRFAPELLANLAAIQYEDHQPPLYYLLAAPVYWLTDGNLTALRLFSAAIGLMIIGSTYAVGRLLFPERPWMGLGAAALVAFLPQQMHILTSVNNDALGWAVVALTLWLTIAYMKNALVGGHPIHPRQLGLLVGIGFLTKATTYFMAGVVLLALVYHWWATRRQDLRATAEFAFPEEVRHDRKVYTQQALRQLACFLLPALLLGGIWWTRNIVVYGFPDFLGLSEHNIVVFDQPRTAERIDALGWEGYLEEITRTTWHSFWGQFGWMALPMPSYCYTLIEILLIVAAGGYLLLPAFRHADPERARNGQPAIPLLLALVVLFSLLAYSYYNAEFQQYQGRYLFTALLPLSLCLMVGLDAWRRLLTGGLQRDRCLNPQGKTRWLWRILPYGTVWGLLLFAALDIYLLWRVITPNL